MVTAKTFFVHWIGRRSFAVISLASARRLYRSAFGAHLRNTNQGPHIRPGHCARNLVRRSTQPCTCCSANLQFGQRIFRACARSAHRKRRRAGPPSRTPVRREVRRATRTFLSGCGRSQSARRVGVAAEAEDVSRCLGACMRVLPRAQVG